MTLHNTWVWLAIGHHKMQWIGYGFDLIPIKVAQWLHGWCWHAWCPPTGAEDQDNGQGWDQETPFNFQHTHRLRTPDLPDKCRRRLPSTTCASAGRKRISRTDGWPWEGSGKCGTSRNLRWSLKYSWSESKLFLSTVAGVQNLPKKMTRIYQRSPGQMSRFQIGGTCHRDIRLMIYIYTSRSVACVYNIYIYICIYIYVYSVIIIYSTYLAVKHVLCTWWTATSARVPSCMKGRMVKLGSKRHCELAGGLTLLKVV